MGCRGKKNLADQFGSLPSFQTIARWDEKKVNSKWVSIFPYKILKKIKKCLMWFLRKNSKMR